MIPESFIYKQNWYRSWIHPELNGIELGPCESTQEVGGDTQPYWFILSNNENVPNLKLPNSSRIFQISLAAPLASQRCTVSVFWQPVSVKEYLPSWPICPLTVHPEPNSAATLALHT